MIGNLHNFAKNISFRSYNFTAGQIWRKEVKLLFSLRFIIYAVFSEIIDDNYQFLLSFKGLA